MQRIVVQPKSWRPDERRLHSPGISANGFLFVSGSLPIDPMDGQIVAGDIRAQTRQVLENIAAVLKAGGSSVAKVVKANVYLVDQEDFAAMNEVYREYFVDNPPARATVGSTLMRPGALVEIEVIALT